MFCLDDDGNTVGMESFHQRIRHLHRQVLLNLQPAGEDVDNARHFGKPDHFSVWDVSDVRLADKRQQMMLAHRVELNVLH